METTRKSAPLSFLRGENERKIYLLDNGGTRMNFVFLHFEIETAENRRETIETFGNGTSISIGWLGENLQTERLHRLIDRSIREEHLLDSNAEFVDRKAISNSVECRRSTSSEK